MDMNEVEASAAEKPEWEKARRALEKVKKVAGGSKYGSPNKGGQNMFYQGGMHNFGYPGQWARPHGFGNRMGAMGGYGQMRHGYPQMRWNQPYGGMQGGYSERGMGGNRFRMRMNANEAQFLRGPLYTRFGNDGKGGKPPLPPDPESPAPPPPRDYAGSLKRAPGPRLQNARTGFPRPRLPGSIRFNLGHVKGESEKTPDNGTERDDARKLQSQGHIAEISQKENFARGNPNPNKGSISSQQSPSNIVGDDQTAWPPELMEYIQRSFQACTSEGDKDKTEAYLKSLLNEKMKNGLAHQINWKNEPLPIELFRPKPELKTELRERLSQKHETVSRPENRKKSRFHRSRYSRSSSRSYSRSRSRSDSPKRRRHRFNSDSSSDNSAIFTSAGRVVGSGRKDAKKSAVASRLGNKQAVGSPKSVIKNIKAQKNRKKKNKKNAQPFKLDDPNKALKMAERASRFHSQLSDTKEKLTFTINNYENDGEEMDWEGTQVVGSCKDIFKPYLRLTSAPDPSTVSVRSQSQSLESLHHVSA